MWDIEEQQNTALESSCLGTIHMWGGDTIRGFHFFPGAQWEPQRDLSRGCLLSAEFEKAVPAVVVREPRQWLRRVGRGARRMDWRVLGTDLEEGYDQAGRMAEKLVLTV